MYGDEQVNMAVSQKRAENVKDYLTTLSIPEDKMLVQAKGKSELASTNPNNQDAERRVEVKVKNAKAGTCPKKAKAEKEEFNSAWDNTDGRLWFDRILAVKRIFTVSYLTVIYCLEERYRATSGKKTVPPYRNWFKENYLRRFGRTLPAHEEACPADVRIESARFIRLARKAFVAGDITMSRLAELLGKSLLDTRALVNEWAREAAE